VHVLSQVTVLFQVVLLSFIFFFKQKTAYEVVM